MYFVTENIAEFQKSQKCGCESQNTQQNRDLVSAMQLGQSVQLVVAMNGVYGKTGSYHYIGQILQPRVKEIAGEMFCLCTEVVCLKKCEEELASVHAENVALKERNALLLESQEHHHTFTLDTCQHAHTQHMELLNISNKFYEWAKEWSNAEKDMTEFVGAEEHKFE
jgi:ABC-type nickel/cobalt efflux system permease component RcnA